MTIFRPRRLAALLVLALGLALGLPPTAAQAANTLVFQNDCSEQVWVHFIYYDRAGARVTMPAQSFQPGARQSVFVTDSSTYYYYA